MENCIEIKNVCKSYTTFALSDVSLSVPCGSVMGFIGENGAGKTTVIKTILGITVPDSGTVSVLGETKLSGQTKEKIGVVFDTVPFPKSLNAKQLDRVMKGVYKTWDSEKFFSLLQRFGIPLKTKIKSFSRGMGMRLSIAAALSHNPQLLVLDEPTGGLDPVVRSEILDLLLEFMQDETHSILISTHITSDLEHIADYISFIHNGRIVFTRERNEMLESHRILKCTDEQLSLIDKEDVIGMRKGRFSNEVLTCAADKYPDIVSDPASIEEIMVFYVKQ